jgi:hypothetical protein
MHRRGVPTGLLMLLATLPWMVTQEHRLAAAMVQDLKEHRWTAYTFDGVLGSIMISAKGLLFCGVAWLTARIVASMVPVRKGDEPGSF